MSTKESEEVELETKTSLWNVFAWSLYDLANTVYSMVIVSLIINQYILIIGQKELGLEYAVANSIFLWVVTATQILIAIGMPIVGALSDTAGRRKPFVIVLTGVILLFASLLGFTHSITLVLLLYVIANIAYQWSLAFYDPMLPFIAAPKDAGKVGGFGVAFGYFGTIIGLIVMLMLQGMWGAPYSEISVSRTDAGNMIIHPIGYGYYGMWQTFFIAMGIFLVFAIPFIFVKERQKKSKIPPAGELIKGSFKQLRETFRDIKGHKEMFKFIIGYFLIVEVANIVVMQMYLLVRDGMGMDPAFSQIFIIIGTLSAVMFTYFIGIFADKKGARNTFILVCTLWFVALLIAVLVIFIWAPVVVPDPLFDFSQWSFPFVLVLLMGILTGPALGGTWVAQRYMIIELAPKEKFGEYFGFSKLSGKISSSIGPAIWAVVFLIFYSSIGFKTYAVAMIAIGVLMVAGLVVVLFVRPEKRILKEVGIEPEK